MIWATPADRRGSEVTAARRSAANAKHRLAQQQWEMEHEGEMFDREWYLREVLPGLKGVSLTVIANTTGMSTSTASKVRAGRRLPHPRWWGRLSALGLLPSPSSLQSSEPGGRGPRG
jgi:hypothetical protein